jgi:hypothetical protein
MNGRFSEVFIFKKMPTTYKRKNDERGRWKQENLKWAINAIKERAVGNNAASKDFDIPSRTLREEFFRITTKNLSVQVRV